MTFLVQFLVRVFADNHIGIFNNLDINWNLLFFENDGFLKSLKTVILFLYLGCAFSCLGLIIIVYFSVKYIGGEYYYPKQVETKLAELVTTAVPQQVNQKIVLQEYLQIKKEVTQ